MKKLLAIALLLLVCVADSSYAAPPRAPIAPMAPGVTNPGVKNADNPDVPHVGDNLQGVGVDEDGILYYADTSTLKVEGGGVRSIVVMVVNRGGDPAHDGAHRMAGRAKFKCAEKQHLDGAGYILNDEGDVIAALPAAEGWGPTEEGTIAFGMAAVVCAKPKIAEKSVEL